MAEGQGKKRKRKKRGNKPYTSGLVQQFLSSLASPLPSPPVYPVLVPPRDRGLTLQMLPNVRQEMRLVMTPTLRFKSDAEIDEAIERGLVLDPDKVG